MRNYILVGSHGNSIIDKSHLNGLVHGIYNLVVKHTIEEAEKFINELNDIEPYVLFNMNILDKKEVHDSKLLKKLIAEKRAMLSYTNCGKLAPVFVPVPTEKD